MTAGAGLDDQAREKGAFAETDWRGPLSRLADRWPDEVPVGLRLSVFVPVAVSSARVTLELACGSLRVAVRDGGNRLMHAGPSSPVGPEVAAVPAIQDSNTGPARGPAGSPSGSTSQEQAA
jgi:hypothetical protein